jgi:protein-S-isoprenylcysteine O-methyltransferase Ste14
MRCHAAGHRLTDTSGRTSRSVLWLRSGLRFSDHGSVKLSKLSISVSLAYVLSVAVITTIASLISPGAGQFAAWLLTLPAGILVLGFLYFLVVPVLDLGFGISGDGALGLTVLVSGYVVAAVVNVLLVMGLMTLIGELRDSRRRARARAAGAST